LADLPRLAGFNHAATLRPPPRWPAAARRWRSGRMQVRQQRAGPVPAARPATASRTAHRAATASR